MDNECKIILNQCNIIFDTIDDLNGIFIPREILISDIKYQEIKKLIPSLKKIMSSTVMTGLHKNAGISQKWPLLNLVRQILHIYKFQMIPIRKADGYTLDGVKKYKRFFQIERNQNNDKKCDDKKCDDKKCNEKKDEDDNDKNGKNINL